MSEQAVYRERAEFYDLIYHWKDYRAEAARVRGYLTAAGFPDGARVVEAACGTGSYLRHLQKHYDVAGFDLNDGMLELARRKLPGVPLFRADMTDFVLDRPADALLCLFSSIGYVFPEERVRRAAACFFRAIRPGGIALVEPWLTPESVTPGHLDVQTYDRPDLKLVRANTHQVDGRKSVFDFHWLVIRPRGIEHFIDRHELWMYTEEEIVRVFREAGFEPRWVMDGLMPGRGLLFLHRA